MTLYEQIVSVLLRNTSEACPHCEIDGAAEELHSLVVELYGPTF